MWSFNRNSLPSHHLTALLSHPPQSKRLPSPFPSSQHIYDCPYPLEAINMQSDYQMNKDHQFDRSLNSHPEYEAVYLAGLPPPPPPPPPPPTDKPWQWQNSPIYGANGSLQYYPGYASYVHPVVDSWMTYRPLPPTVTPPPYKSYSMERLNHPSVVYSFRSPAPSPVHTPSSSPVLSRARGSSPGSAMGRPGQPNQRRVAAAPPIPPPKNGAASKPPRPLRNRPTLVKAKTIDFADGCNDADPFQPQKPLEVGNKIPSLDSLYEQLKAFAAATPPPSAPLAPASPCPTTRSSRTIDNQMAADLAAAALEMVANSPLVRSRSATFSGAPSSFAFNSRPKPEMDERLQRLEGDKDSLQMQVSILMDQIEAQTDKIADLERTLSDRAFQLQKAEDNLQKEMLSRSAAETRQLELLSDISGLKLRYAAVEKDNMDLRGQLKRSEQDMITLVSQCYTLCGATLGPGFNKKDMLENLQSMNLRSNATSPASVVGTPPRHPGSATAELPRRALLSANSASSLQSSQSHQVSDSPRPSYMQSPKTPPASAFRKLDQDAYNSLPRQTSTNSHHNNNNNSLSSAGNNPPVTANKRAVVFAETEQKRLQDEAASSAERDDVMAESSFNSPTSPHSPSLNSFSKQPRGSLKKIFDKLKRANSGALEGDPSTPLSTEDFRRGGTLRATAGPRLGWKNGSPGPAETIKPIQESELPFLQWSSDDIASWLHDMGLHLYVSEVQRWGCRGQQLLEVPVAEIEKELSIKHPLHKKKLILALEAKDRAQDPMSLVPILPDLLKHAGKLDHQWAVRWLDDIGLPQYKDAFLECRVDGRMLHLLSVDDLCTHLKVTNLLHLICIRRGIQVLRLNDYNPSCLQRRSVPEDPAHPTPGQVAVWTNHRVMEWLRAVDLSEYAPNMRGSGVHGGLLVHEARFNAELLATLLSIPQGKTLLRRHLATHFNQLVGREVVQAKREMETSSAYPPLTPVAKVKIIKKSQFTLKRRKGKPDEFDSDDWVCPPFDSSDLDNDKISPPKSPMTKSTDL
ncbi:liprin-beta-2-like isoform X2 [Daphnia pulicaria]|uniref:liprin-beta-2-like isoform X2 n=1 Tax=Daphnia pulicaria TaxID=35523 RepID=UPI001EEC8D2F|nr:liprin-beta-2-like isoform X2 [Daphnia pulicaria]